MRKIVDDASLNSNSSNDGDRFGGGLVERYIIVKRNAKYRVT